ncbi:MAG TPA: protein kinase [Gemmatimonadales bacterium]|nr:protein kinase [Gemmatimonadales bacterium]
MPESAARLTAALADRYRIERELGAGGMATVYLAQDLKHDRKVAVKVLRPELAAVLGADRFVQEIKTTAALQHPHILPLFDSGEADGFLFYVMPYVEGETLRDKLNRETQFSIDDAVRITTEVADALDYAHRHGVVHRDIKPENILLHDGRPMVADFGIALALSAAAGGRMTETGMSLGTPHYMSPEQATADKDITGRSDIYSLASMLYEMLTGNPPHVGSSAQQIIMKIIAEDVKPVTEFRRSVPANVAAAVSKALEKLPADRFDSAKAFAEALTNPSFTTPTAASAAAAAVPATLPHSHTATVVLAAALVLALAAAVWGWLRPGAPAAPMAEREIVLGSMGTRPGNVESGTAIAPDGSAIVYVDTSAAGVRQLMLKERDRLAPRVLATLKGEYEPGPSFSPDGQSIAFLDGTLYRVSRSGGAPVRLSDSSGTFTTAWLDNGTIVWMDRGSTHLYAAPSSGGPTRRVLSVDSAGYTYRHVSPIPDADAVLVGVLGPHPRVVVLNLGTGKTRVLQPGAVNAWVLGRRLLYVEGNGALYSAPFDRNRLTISGAAEAVLDSIQMNSYAATNPSGDITVGADGTLLYVRRSPLAAAGGQHLARVAMDGSAELLDTAQATPVAYLGGLDLSPDGRRVAMSLTESKSGRSDIYVYDLRGGPPTRLTFDGTTNIRPAWSPDGKRIMYVSDAGGGPLRLWVKSVDGAGAPRLLIDIGGIYGGEWSPDGRWVVYRTDAAVTGTRDILAVRTDGDSTPVPLAATGAQELAPAVSPDGHWLAYSSDVNGFDQVFVRPFPKAAGGVWQVSSGVGLAPRWSHDGRTIFYQNTRNQMFAADVSTVPTFHIERQRVLFSGPYFAYGYYHMYSVAPDDRHFVMLELPPGALGRGAHLVEIDHWRPGTSLNSVDGR